MCSQAEREKESSKAYARLKKRGRPHVKKMKNMQRVGVTEDDARDKMRWRQVVDLMVLLSFAVSVPTVGLFP